MDQQTATKTIRQIIETLLAKLDVEGRVEVFESTEEVKFIIRTPEAGILIGENGQNLFALNHLVKRMSEQVFPKEEKPVFSLDINDYRAKKAEELKAVARIGAQRARYLKRGVLMKPMTAYERRIVHTALLEHPDITTESVGQEPKRQVVIKPYS